MNIGEILNHLNIKVGVNIGCFDEDYNCVRPDFWYGDEDNPEPPPASVLIQARDEILLAEKANAWFQKRVDAYNADGLTDHFLIVAKMDDDPDVIADIKARQLAIKKQFPKGQ